MYTTKIGTDLDEAIAVLNASELVAIPTETVYGLAANALDVAAVSKIFEAKNRPFFNPLILHFATVNQIEQYAELDETSKLLANHFMPGPFTLLLNKKKAVPDLVTAGSNKVAVRIPNHTMTLQLLSQLHFPLAAPSANPFGYVSPVTANHVLQGLQGKIKYILDGGNCTVGLESTIIEVDNNQIVLHRAGGISIEEIEAVVGRKIIIATHHSKPQTSGQLKSHYATSTPLLQGNIVELLKQFSGSKIAIISFQQQYQSIDVEHQFVLSSKGDLSEAAQNLFGTMRKLDNMNYDIIIAENFPNTGLGVAINDRLKKAQITQKV
jgi:L-threonylcarbamoyladenylate synthase